MFDDIQRQKEHTHVPPRVKIIHFNTVEEVVETLIPPEIRAYFFRVMELLENKEFVTKALKSPTIACPNFGEHSGDKFTSLRYRNYLPTEQLTAHALATLLFKGEDLTQAMDHHEVLRMELIASTFLGINILSLHDRHLGRAKSRYTIRAFLKDTDIQAAGELSKLPTPTNRKEELLVERELQQRMRRGLMTIGTYSPWLNAMSAIQKKAEYDEKLIDCNTKSAGVAGLTEGEREKLRSVSRLIREGNKKILGEIGEPPTHSDPTREVNPLVGATKGERAKFDSRLPGEPIKAGGGKMTEDKEEKKVTVDLRKNLTKYFVPGPCRVVQGDIVPIEEEELEQEEDSWQQQESVIKNKLEILFRNPSEVSDFYEQNKEAGNRQSKRNETRRDRGKRKYSFYLPSFPRRPPRNFKGDPQAANFLTNLNSWSEVVGNVYNRNNPCFIGPLQGEYYDRVNEPRNFEDEVRLGAMQATKAERGDQRHWTGEAKSMNSWMRNSKNLLDSQVEWEERPNQLKLEEVLQPMVATEQEANLETMFQIFDSTHRATQGKRSRKSNNQGDKLVNSFLDFLIRTLPVNQQEHLDGELLGKPYNVLSDQWDMPKLIAEFLDKTLFLAIGQIEIKQGRKLFKVEKLVVQDPNKQSKGLVACFLSKDNRYIYRAKIKREEVLHQIIKNMKHHELSTKILSPDQIEEFNTREERDTGDPEYDEKLGHIGPKLIKCQSNYRYICKNHLSNASSIDLKYENLPSPQYTELVAGNAQASSQFDMRDYYSQIPCEGVASMLSAIRCRGEVYLNTRGAQGLAQSVFFAQNLSSKIMTNLSDNLLKQKGATHEGCKSSLEEIKIDARRIEQEFWSEQDWMEMEPEASYDDLIPPTTPIFHIIEEKIESIRETAHWNVGTEELHNKRPQTPTVYSQLLESQDMEEDEWGKEMGLFIRNTNIIDDLIATSCESIRNQNDGRSAEYWHLKIHITMYRQLVSNLHFLSDEGLVMKVNPLKSNIASPTISFLSKIFHKGRRLIDVDDFKHLKSSKETFPLTTEALASFAASCR